MIRMLSRLSRDERGAVMVMTAVTFVALLLFAGLALDFGRAHLLRAQLQTAVDAASLAGALQVVPMVELSIPRMEASEETCYDPVTQKPYDCTRWYRATPASISGPEWDLLTKGGWRSQVGSDCDWPYRCSSPRKVREWLVLPASTEPVARSTFAQNSRWPGGTLGPTIDTLAIQIKRDTVEVRATATMTMPTTFLRLAGIPTLQFTRSGQAQPVRR